MSDVCKRVSKWLDKDIDNIFKNHLYECQMDIDAYLNKNLEVKKLIKPINIEFADNMGKDSSKYEIHNKQRLIKTLKIIKEELH